MARSPRSACDHSLCFFVCCCRALYPSGCLHKADAGGSHTYNTASAVLQPISQLASPFVMPSTPLLPLDTSYDTSLPSDVPVSAGPCTPCTLKGGPRRKAKRQG